MNIAKITLLGALALSTQVDAKSCKNNKYKQNNCNYSSGKCNGYKDTNKKNKKGKKGKQFKPHKRSIKVPCSGKGVYGSYDTVTKSVTTSKKTSKTISEIPTGELSLDKDKIRQGLSAKVSWNINFPSVVIEEVVDITENGSVTTKTDLRVDVYMIGSAISGHRSSSETEMKFGSGDWVSIYKGYGKDIDSSKPVHTTYLKEGQEIKFKSRSNESYHIGWTSNTDDEVMVMRDGDYPDTKQGWGGDSSMEDYVRPYMKDGALDIGTLDLMFAAELTTGYEDRSHSSYDSNDSIVLVRFTVVNTVVSK